MKIRKLPWQAVLLGLPLLPFFLVYYVFANMVYATYFLMEELFEDPTEDARHKAAWDEMIRKDPRNSPSYVAPHLRRHWPII